VNLSKRHINLKTQVYDEQTDVLCIDGLALVMNDIWIENNHNLIFFN
jgi:hypothetical protein